MNKIIPTPIYFISKKLNIKLSNIKILDGNKKNNSILYRVGNFVVKPETNLFYKNIYPSIKKLNLIDQKYIPNYKSIQYKNFNYFYYEYIEGKKFYNYIYKLRLKNNRILINNMIKFIKFYINIDTKKFDNLTTIPPCLIRPSIIFENDNISFTRSLKNNLEKIYNISIKKQKKTNKKLLLFEDLNTHNILIDKKNNIKLIDMSDGIIIGNYNLYIHRYFSFLWSFGEKTIDKALIDCNINNDDTLTKELSFVYFCRHHIFSHGLCDNIIDRLKSFIVKYKYYKISKNILKTLS